MIESQQNIKQQIDFLKADTPTFETTQRVTAVSQTHLDQTSPNNIQTTTQLIGKNNDIPPETAIPKIQIIENIDSASTELVESTESSTPVLGENKVRILSKKKSSVASSKITKQVTPQQNEQLAIQSSVGTSLDQAEAFLEPKPTKFGKLKQKTHRSKAKEKALKQSLEQSKPVKVEGVKESLSKGIGQLFQKVTTVLKPDTKKTVTTSETFAENIQTPLKNAENLDFKPELAVVKTEPMKDVVTKLDRQEASIKKTEETAPLLSTPKTEAAAAAVVKTDGKHAIIEQVVEPVAKESSVISQEEPKFAKAQKGKQKSSLNLVQREVRDEVLAPQVTEKSGNTQASNVDVVLANEAKEEHPLDLASKKSQEIVGGSVDAEILAPVAQENVSTGLVEVLIESPHLLASNKNIETAQDVSDLPTCEIPEGDQADLSLHAIFKQIPNKTSRVEGQLIETEDSNLLKTTGSIEQTAQEPTSIAISGNRVREESLPTAGENVTHQEVLETPKKAQLVLQQNLRVAQMQSHEEIAPGPKIKTVSKKEKHVKFQTDEKPRKVSVKTRGKKRVVKKESASLDSSQNVHSVEPTRTQGASDDVDFAVKTELGQGLLTAGEEVCLLDEDAKCEAGHEVNVITNVPMIMSVSGVTETEETRLQSNELAPQSANVVNLTKESIKQDVQIPLEMSRDFKQQSPLDSGKIATSSSESLAVIGTNIVEEASKFKETVTGTEHIEAMPMSPKLPFQIQEDVAFIQTAPSSNSSKIERNQTANLEVIESSANQETMAFSELNVQPIENLNDGVVDKQSISPLAYGESFQDIPSVQEAVTLQGKLELKKACKKSVQQPKETIEKKLTVATEGHEVFQKFTVEGSKLIPQVESSTSSYVITTQSEQEEKLKNLEKSKPSYDQPKTSEDASETIVVTMPAAEDTVLQENEMDEKATKEQTIPLAFGTIALQTSGEQKVARFTSKKHSSELKKAEISVSEECLSVGGQEPFTLESETAEKNLKKAKPLPINTAFESNAQGLSETCQLSNLLKSKIEYSKAFKAIYETVKSGMGVENVQSLDSLIPGQYFRGQMFEIASLRHVKKILEHQVHEHIHALGNLSPLKNLKQPNATQLLATTISCSHFSCMEMLALLETQDFNYDQSEACLMKVEAIVQGMNIETPLVIGITPRIQSSDNLPESSHPIQELALEIVTSTENKVPDQREEVPFWKDFDRKISFCRAVSNMIQNIQQNRTEQEVLVQFETQNLSNLPEAGQAVVSLSQRLLNVAEATEFTNFALTTAIEYPECNSALHQILHASGAEYLEVIPLIELSDFTPVERADTQKICCFSSQQTINQPLEVKSFSSLESTAETCTTTNEQRPEPVVLEFTSKEQFTSESREEVQCSDLIKNILGSVAKIAINVKEGVKISEVKAGIEEGRYSPLHLPESQDSIKSIIESVLQDCQIQEQLDYSFTDVLETQPLPAVALVDIIAQNVTSVEAILQGPHLNEHVNACQQSEAVRKAAIQPLCTAEVSNQAVSYTLLKIY